MINLQLPSRPPIEDTQPAQDFDPGSTFYDSDGDLYLRCNWGCIRFEQDAMVPYAEDAMGSYAYFKRCTAANINVNVTLH